MIVGEDILHPGDAIQKFKGCDKNEEHAQPAM
jgi:hypothetical protein